MLVLALFAILMDHTISVPQSHWLAIDVTVQKPHTVVECSIEVEEGMSPIDALLLTRADAERFNRGRSFEPLRSTGFQHASRLRHEIDQPGQYVLLLDNRLEGRSATKAKVRIELWAAEAGNVTTVPQEKRRAIIALSFLFFAGVAAFSARQFLK